MILDFLGSVFSLTSTVLFIRLHLAAWPIGLLATCINGWLYWQKGIYGDMSLELFYFITLCYGWHRWYQQRETPTFALKTLNTTQWFWLMGCILGCFGLLVGLLKTFSNSTVPLLDALTTVLSLAAQWLLCYKVMATWILWFVVDLLYAVLYFNKALPFHTILTISYTGLAIIGYWHWRKASQSPSIEITSEPTA